MNLTKEIITDLLPLYAANECSKDSRALVEDYLRENPGEAAELKHVMSKSVLGSSLRLPESEEVRTLREARRRVRRQSWLMGLAIFFSLVPFSFLVTSERIYWLFRESPGSAVVYAVIGVALWCAYFFKRRASGILSNPESS